MLQLRTSFTNKPYALTWQGKRQKQFGTALPVKDQHFVYILKKRSPHSGPQKWHIPMAKARWGNPLVVLMAMLVSLGRISLLPCGGYGAYGGGAFFGKDPTKVDWSGAYLVRLRQATKRIVASGLARRTRCILQVFYAIRVPEPLSVFVDTYGTGKIHYKEIKENFNFKPGMIAINLDLKRGGNGRFLKTAVWGYFGRDD
jgi:hypothetical protein